MMPPHSTGLNWASLFGFIISVICIVIYCWLVVRQVIETTRPKDGLSRLRLIILCILLLTLVTSTTPTVYQYFRAFGHNYLALQNTSTVLSNVSKIGNAILLVLVYTYRTPKE